MAVITCKNCSTDIDTTQSDQDQPFIICPTCEAVLSDRSTEDDVAAYMPSLRSLPSRMSIKVLDDELVITCRWFGWGHIALGSIVYFLLTFGLFFSEVSTLEFVINPLTWLMAGLGYYLLTRLVNTTVVRASPTNMNRHPIMILAAGKPLPLRTGFATPPANCRKDIILKVVIKAVRLTCWSWSPYRV